MNTPALSGTETLSLPAHPRLASPRRALRFAAGLFGLGLLFAAPLAHAQGVSAVTVSDTGSGYTSVPTVVFAGGGGSGAAATAIVYGGGVSSVRVTASGSGYTSAPTVSFTGGGGSNAAAAAQTATLTFTNYPFQWAVIGGVYRYYPAAQTSAPAATITFSLIQAPSWLTFASGLLSGTPPNSEQGLSDLVVLQANDTASNTATLSYRINVGNAVGPVSTPPGGGTIQWVTGMPQVARTGFDVQVVSGVANGTTIPIFWGLQPSGFAMEMDYSGPSGSGGADFTVPSNFTFASYEIGYWYPLGSNLAGGFSIWQGSTYWPPSSGGLQVFTYLTAGALDLASSPVPFIKADTLGLDETVGALAQVDATDGLRIGMALYANAVGGAPALVYFNNLAYKQPTDRAVTQVDTGFYWVNTSPQLTANNDAPVDQGGTVVLTTDMLNASDNEQGPGEITFTIPSNPVDGAPTYNGVVQVDDGSGSWATTLGQGSSFTLAQLQNGWVRYVNNGAYQTFDSFEFGVTDGYGGYARDGSFTIFTFGIDVTLVEHPPVAGSPGLAAALGGTSTGTLSFTDPDMGFESDTYTVTLTGSSTLGTLTITDPSTGAFSFTAGTTVGSESVGWQVTNGAYTVSGTLSITVANGAPAVSPLSIAGGASSAIMGTLVATDPNVPAESVHFTVLNSPAKGNVVINGSQVSYTASAGRFGADSFTVLGINSGGSISAAQTVTVMIQPDTILPSSLFIAGDFTGNPNNTGVIQRVNPSNGDIYTVATNLGNGARGMAWWPQTQKLLVIVAASNPAINAVVAVDPISGAWSFGTIVTSNNLLTFPISLSANGPGSVLVADGGGGVVRVALATGAQQALSLGLPAAAFVASAIPSPDGSNNIWVANDEILENPDNSNLFIGNLGSGTATSPVTFSPAGDVAAIIPNGPNSVAIARAGVPVETLGVNPVSYTPLAGLPTAPYALPVGLVAYPPTSSWLIADGQSGALYSQLQGTSTVQPVSVPGLSNAWGLFVLNPATQLSVSAPSATIAGAPVTVTVAPLDSSGNPAFYSGTLHLTSSDGAASLPANAGLAATNSSFTVTLNTPGSQTITAADTVNGSLTVTTAPISVGVATAPAITTQPVSQTASAGSNATFTVQVTGNPAPGYQWYVGGSPIPGATSPTLTLTNVQLGNAGIYTVTATNDAGSATSKAATLAVDAAPVITVNSTVQTVNAGSNLTLSFVATGYPVPTYQWTLNGTAIPGATRTSLTLSRITVANGGTYDVTATNAMGSVTRPVAVVIVDVAPSIGIISGSQTANTGANVTFSTVLSGNPIPTAQWYVGGVLIPGASSNQLTLNTVQLGNAGNYTVTATNSVSSVTSAVMTLTVKGGPVFTTQPQSLTVAAGNSVTFTSAATGNPVPTYQWFLGATPITGATSASLTLINVKAANAGTYSVTATNTLGSTPSNGAVLAIQVAPAITTQPLSQTVSATSNVTLSVVATGSGTLSYQWKFNGNPINGATSSSYALTNVQAGNAGTYAVTVTNVAGDVVSHNAVLKVN